MIRDIDLTLLKHLCFKSIDKDNMEFNVYATYAQRDALNRVIEYLERKLENAPQSRLH